MKEVSWHIFPLSFSDGQNGHSKNALRLDKQEGAEAPSDQHTPFVDRALNGSFRHNLTLAQRKAVQQLSASNSDIQLPIDQSAKLSFVHALHGRFTVTQFRVCRTFVLEWPVIRESRTSA